MTPALRKPKIDLLSIIDKNQSLSPKTRHQYRKVASKFLNDGGSLNNPDDLIEYSKGLSNVARSYLKSVVNLYAEEMKDHFKGMATPENVNAVQAAIFRFEALQKAITVQPSKGQKAHTWLSETEIEHLLSLPDENSIQGKRDLVIIALLIGAGLRREELVSLTFDAVKKQGDRWVLDVMGKGSKNRVIPISERLASILYEWQENVQGGRIARSLGRKKQIGESISTTAIFNLVRKYGKNIGKPELAPHDLRRTYAQIGLENGITIEQISKLLGHSSVKTTQRYLNVDLDLDTTISDFILT